MAKSLKRKLFLFLSFLCISTFLFIRSVNFSHSIGHKIMISSYYDFQNKYDTQPHCHIPKLLVFDPSVKHLLRNLNTMMCSPMKNWVYTDNGKFYIDIEPEMKYGKIQCDYYDVKRINEEFQELILYKNFLNGSYVLGDGFRVNCTAEKGQKYRNVHFTVPQLPVIPVKKNQGNLLSDLHILFYIIDSVSRINVMRKLPQFYKMLTEDMSAIVMEGFNIVGDGTPWAIIPLTTGHFQNELPDARKRFSNSSFLDDWPFIFKEYRKAGYGTVYAEESPKVSAFTYKLKGFNNPQMDHYLRPVLAVLDGEREHQLPYCLGDTPLALSWLNYWKELKNMYERHDRRTLSILFTSEISHDEYNLVQAIDTHLMKGFKKLTDDNLLNNTFLFVMADHGRRFGPIRQTQSGKLEEKLPFLAVVPPPWFAKSYPKSYSNLLKNKNRLFTVFDLHETMRYFLNFTEDGGLGKLDQRGISLLQEIPLERTCKEAHIKPHFCACLDWTLIPNPSTNTNVIDSITTVVKEINQWLQVANGSCAVITLKNIITANVFTPKEDLMSFKGSLDYDNYSPDLSASSTASAVYYQIRFVTWPGDADWEVTVTHYVDTNQFQFSEDNLSRLNQYGDQPKCIMYKIHHLRSYCYCLENRKL